MNIHKYLAEKGFELTGEYRNAQPDEWLLSASGTVRWEDTEPTWGNYLILKKLCDSFEFDGLTFRLPEGYELVRVGVPKMSDVEAGYYISSFLGVSGGGIVSKLSVSAVRCCVGGIYFILKKKESK